MQEDNPDTNKYRFVRHHYNRFEKMLVSVAPSVVRKLQAHVKVKSATEEAPVPRKRKKFFSFLIVSLLLAMMGLSLFEPAILLFVIIAVIMLLSIEMEQGKL